LVLFDTSGQIRWMNRGARESLGTPASILEVLWSRPRLPAMECLALGQQWLWLGAVPDQRRLDRLRQLHHALWGVYCRRDTRNLDLSRAGGRLEAHQRRATRERFLRRAGLDFLQAIECERGRIARELHDNAGQSLAGILLNLDLVERQLGSSHTEVLARLRRSRELASLTLDQVRRISHELHPPEWQDQDFSQAVEWLIDRMDLRSRLEIDLVQLDLPRDTPPALLTVLYRTLQEGFTNILRHAEATRVFVDVSTSPRGVTLLLEDNGRGFDPALLGTAGHGIGLVNLRRRLASLGGRLHLDSAPGAGARLSAFLPLRSEHGRAP
jgi:signal transduction histidine kinase